MSKSTRTALPPMDAAYTDEFGRIEPDVYGAASAIWQRCEQYALATLGRFIEVTVHNWNRKPNLSTIPS